MTYEQNCVETADSLPCLTASEDLGDYEEHTWSEERLADSVASKSGGDEEVKKGHRNEEREWPKGRGGDGGVARHRRQGDGGEDAR